MPTVVAARPAEESSASISEKIEALKADRTAALERIAAETTRRVQLLRTGGTDKEIRANEEAARQAGLIVERADVMIQHLTGELEEAQRREALAHVLGLRAEAVAASDKFIVWWTETYPQLAAEIAEGLALQDSAYAPRRRFMEAVDRLEPGQVAELPALPGVGHVMLPAVEAGAEPIIGLEQDLYVHRRRPISERQAAAYSR
jgi:hypothetical protein